ncbi:dnaJ-like protein 60 [Venturia canescens]|uniref:dnaJ-like protein 60 n=1 Tax=Venturia canescens TaxID=32260 RepID=UPI001C9C5D1C|nr:dnaJ-like protein 60 [Venturia canescens]
MSLFVRAVIRNEIMHVRKLFCGSARNTRTHYETLRIHPDASQREIRLAFIKLSKEMHPDTGKKSNHSDFVKISEAYKVLSKLHTRQRYDADLQFEKASQDQKVRKVYYDNEINSFRDASGMHGPFDPRDPSYEPYGIRGGKHLTKVTIAMLCLLFSAVGFACQMLLVKASMSFNGKKIAAQNKKYQEAYDEVRAEANRLNREEQIAAFEERSAASRAKLAARYRS